MPRLAVSERAHGVSRVRRAASAALAFSAPEPEPEPEPKAAPPQPAPAPAPAPKAPARFSDQLIASLLGDEPSAGGRRPLRPSLADQLANATSGVDEVLEQFGEGRKSAGLIYSAPARSFAVAECASRQPSSMSFFADRATYAFAHPQRGRIDMVMYYKDMRQPLVTRSQLLFTFRVNKTLRHFVDEYNPTDPGHLLALCFRSLDGLEKFEQLILHRIEGR